MLNTKLASALVLAASTFAAGGAMAQPVFAYTDAGVTRAMVQAELQAAQANGQYAALESDSYSVFFANPAKSVVTRDQVRAETAAARASGLIDVLDSDSHMVFFTPAGKSAVTRSQVQADLANARAHGDTASLENNS